MLAQGAASDTALVLPDGTQIKYCALRESVDRALRMLEFLPNRSLIAIGAEASVDFVVLYLAILESQHVALLLPPRFTASQIAGIANAFEPELFALSSASSAVVSDYRNICAFGPFAILKGPFADKKSLHPDLSTVLLTSGSTGKPQGVRLSSANILANAESICEGLRIDSADRAINSLPLHYCYGLSVLNSHLFAGASMVITGDSPTQPDFWRTFCERDATSFAGVPLVYDAAWRVFSRSWPGRLKTLTQSGGRLHDEVARRYVELADRHDGRFIAMYGQTEATARISCVDIVERPDRIGSVGKAIPGGSVTVGPALDGIHGGEVTYRGPNVMMGYASSRADLEKGDELGGVLQTGDLGVIEDGFLYLTGRLKRISKIHGRRICLDEVQAALASVGDVAVSGTDNEIFVFHVAPYGSRLAKSIDAICAAFNISRSDIRTSMIDSLPVTASGKIDYGTLRDRASILHIDRSRARLDD
ncbi:AMP-binding protein [Nocardia vinacea]|uniref:AMP-binding protein n=1 Tax=Nocardia vinacea TaxID=96468 RepID=UPI0033CF3402